MTDIVFDLFDFSKDARNQIAKRIKESKQKTLTDHINHNFSFIDSTTGIGFTYVSHGTDNPDHLKRDLLGISEMRKYKHQSAKWIGLGSFYSSDINRFNLAISDDSEWQYDSVLEEVSNRVLHKGGMITYSDGHKVGRNDPCPCNSGKKYKKCCGTK